MFLIKMRGDMYFKLRTVPSTLYPLFIVPVFLGWVALFATVFF